MIYPDVTLEEWLKKYPALKVFKKACHFCKAPRIAKRPFIDTNWVGLQSEDCSCGKGKAIAVSMIRESSPLKEKESDWLDDLQKK